MSRRDTIIIALLVNAGLLALLFMLAINTEDENIIEQPEITKAVVDSHPHTSSSSIQRNQSSTHPSKSLNVNDEVDNFLKDLAAADNSQPMLIEEDGYIEMAQETPTIVSKVIKQERSSESENFVEVTVKRGDALEKIARSNGTTVEAIKKANHLVSAKLSIGQILKIPVSAKFDENKQVAAFASEQKSNTFTSPPPALKETVKKPPTQVEIQYYTIKSGDNPWKIAKQYNVKFEDLLRLNNLDEERARNLKIGDKVRVK